MGAAIIAGYVLAALVVVAVIVLLTMFTLNRRSAHAGDHYQSPDPAGWSDPARSDTGAAVFDATPGGRTRRRDSIPPIRVADASDETRLAEIEAQSPLGLRGSGLGALPSPALRDGDAAAAVLLVAGRPPVAYIRVDEVDGIAHVDQLAVLPTVARRGIGKALLDAAVDWAAEQGYRAMTLSTFADSEWNQRVYDATGFAPIDSLTPGLRELRDWERAIGLDSIGTRVVMRRELRA